MSFALYKEKKGWNHFPPVKIQRLTTPLTSKHTSRRNPTFPSYFQTSKFNDVWYYKQHPKPLTVISLYCKANRIAPIDTRSLDRLNQNLDISKIEFSILKELYQKRVYQLTFFLNRLIYEFSREFYLIILPIMHFEQLIRLVSWLPYARFYFTNTNIHVWTYLTIEIVQWLSEELGLHVLSVTPHYYSPQPDFAWFDQESLHWLPPLILTN